MSADKEDLSKTKVNQAMKVADQKISYSTTIIAITFMIPVIACSSVSIAQGYSTQWSQKYTAPTITLLATSSLYMLLGLIYLICLCLHTRIVVGRVIYELVFYASLSVCIYLNVIYVSYTHNGEGMLQVTKVAWILFMVVIYVQLALIALSYLILLCGICCLCCLVGLYSQPEVHH